MIVEHDGFHNHDDLFHEFMHAFTGESIHGKLEIFYFREFLMNIKRAGANKDALKKEFVKITKNKNLKIIFNGKEDIEKFSTGIVEAFLENSKM